MRRHSFAPRTGWQRRLENVGMYWHGAAPDHPVPYWAETAGYSLTPAEIAELQRHAQAITDMVLAATDFAISQQRLGDLGIPDFLHGAVQESWERDDPTLYLRLDLAYRQGQPPKLLEVNGQTPTSLLEAAVCQWQWLEDRQQRGELSRLAAQWNTIHEALIEQWLWLKGRGLTEVMFAADPNAEDVATVTYLRELANAVGISTDFMTVDQLGLSAAEPYIFDLWPRPIQHLMWLWPFEFAWDSPAGKQLATLQTRFLEPLWKIVPSSKGILALLHELYPTDPRILPASLNVGALPVPCVQKPLFSREGQNVRLPGGAPTAGDYGGYPLLEQAYTELPTFYAADQTVRYPVLGVWVAGDEVCGLGIREGRGRVTDNRASFAPHWVTAN